MSCTDNTRRILPIYAKYWQYITDIANIYYVLPVYDEFCEFSVNIAKISDVLPLLSEFCLSRGIAGRSV